MKAVSVNIDSVHIDPANLRMHPARNLDTIKASLARFGQQKPIVVDGNGICRAGNGTLEAARALGWEKIEVVKTPLAGSEAIAYAIADNRTAELALWDDDRLGETLKALQLEDFNLDDIGFSQDELDELLGPEPGEAADDPGPQIDKADELQTKWKTKRGQLWEIGRHRLLCGDSTRAEDVAKVMGGERAGVMNTDPPYGVAYANDERPNPGVAKPRVANDELTDETLQAFLEEVFSQAVSHALKPDAAWYMWHAHLTQGYFAAAAAAANVVLHRQIIWVKPVLLLGRGQYHWKHEPCFMGWVEGNQPPDYGLGNDERTQTTVWEVNSISQADRKEFDHSTPKPVELFSIPIVKHLKRGECAYEPFAGSGPLISSPPSKPAACAIWWRLRPKYCVVILERMAGMKLEPVLSQPAAN